MTGTKIVMALKFSEMTSIASKSDPIPKTNLLTNYTDQRLLIHGSLFVRGGHVTVIILLGVCNWLDLCGVLRF